MAGVCLALVLCLPAGCVATATGGVDGNLFGSGAGPEATVEASFDLGGGMVVGPTGGVWGTIGQGVTGDKRVVGSIGGRGGIGCYADVGKRGTFLEASIRLGMRKDRVDTGVTLQGWLRWLFLGPDNSAGGIELYGGETWVRNPVGHQVDGRMIGLGLVIGGLKAWGGGP